MGHCSVKTWYSWYSPAMRRLVLLGLLVASGAAAKVPAPTVDLANRPPELELPPYHRVAPGRAIAFGLNVVDQDGDTVRVDLLEKPASAQYDPVTLTVRWKPTAKDAPQGRFLVKVTETQRKGGGRRAFLHDFAIA